MDYENDIPLQTAVQAFGGVSMNPERRGESTRNEYAQTLQKDYENFRQHAEKGGTLAILESEFQHYRAGYRAHWLKYLHSNARCISSFIAGPSNFPVRRAEKRNNIAHARLNDLFTWQERARRAVIRELRPDLRPIMAGDVDALERLHQELDKAQRSQEWMRTTNATIRKHAKAGREAQIAALVELGHSDRMAADLLKADFCGRIGFADYELQNNGANIRRIEKRIEQITAAKAAPVQTIEGTAATLMDDPPANRVRLIFPGKPSADVRSMLKASGFRWAPSVGAWQAYRNQKTIDVAKRVATAA